MLTRYIAPGIPEFDSAEIPDMTSHNAESSFWVSNHFLNSVMRGSLELPAGAYVFNYLRRAEGAFSQHALARAATADFLSTGRQAPSPYAAALLYWEFFLGQSWQGYALLNELIRFLTKSENLNVFEKGDGSVEERLWLLYNSMKHAESRIAHGQILEDTTSPVWLSNQGLECTEGTLTYIETGDILRDLAKWADAIVDPIEMAVKLQTLITEDSDD
jgi:hypothetical protein